VNLEQLRSYVDEVEATPLGALMDKSSPAVRAALKRSLNREELTTDEGLLLLTADGDDLRAVIKCADLARAEDVGDEVTYVVNRNINFTNICFVGCQFCGFKRQKWESDATTIPMRRSSRRSPMPSRAAQPKSACRVGSTLTCRRLNIATCW
jgi:hypothetical protein